MGSAEKSREIGVNITSLLPHTMFARDRKEVAEILRTEGFDFVSTMAFRGADKDGEWPIPVKYVENAWNPTKKPGLGALLEFLRGVMGDPEASKIHDLIAFPDKARADRFYETLLARHPDATPIVDDLESVDPETETLLEIGPALMMNPGQIVRRLEPFDNTGLCLDLHHLRRELWPNEIAEKGLDPKTPSALGDWRESLSILGRHADLVDVQAVNAEETIRTSRGELTELYKMLDELAMQGYSGPCRIEMNLGLKTQVFRPQVVIDTICRMRDIIVNVMGQ